MRFYSDDPVRDAARYDAYCDRHYVPICSHCDLPIEGEIYETFLCSEVCEYCYDKYYREDEED